MQRTAHSQEITELPNGSSFRIQIRNIDTLHKKDVHNESYAITKCEYISGKYTEKDLKNALRARGLSGGKVAIHSEQQFALHIPDPPESLDRKSTRLNSSHLVISYAV